MTLHHFSTAVLSSFISLIYMKHEKCIYSTGSMYKKKVVYLVRTFLESCKQGELFDEASLCEGCISADLCDEGSENQQVIPELPVIVAVSLCQLLQECITQLPVRNYGDEEGDTLANSP